MNKYLIIFIIFGCLVAEPNIKEQLELNEQKGLILHIQYSKMFHFTLQKEYVNWQQNANEEQRTKMKQVFEETKVQIAKVEEEKSKEREKITQEEKEKIIETFTEIVKQKTPEKMLQRRAVTMGHTLFHSLEKKYIEERYATYDIYLECIKKMGAILQKENIEEIVTKKRDTFELQENIKKRIHKLTHSFQVLDEYEFSPLEKQWILKRLQSQIRAEETQRNLHKQQIRPIVQTYIETKKVEQKKLEKAEADKQLQEIVVSIEARRASYVRNMDMYTQRRMANLQREIYYFKGFIDAEVGRYKKANFPESIIQNLKNKHWGIFLDMTGINFKRWLTEDNIIFIRYLVKELKEYGNSPEKIEDVLLEITK